MRPKKSTVEKLETKLKFHEKKLSEISEKIADIKRVGFKYKKQ